MGKSTVIQSLLLLRQSMVKNSGISGLKVNGEYICLGNGQDILYEKEKFLICYIGKKLKNVSYPT